VLPDRQVTVPPVKGRFYALRWYASSYACCPREAWLVASETKPSKRLSAPRTPARARGVDTACRPRQQVPPACLSFGAWLVPLGRDARAPNRRTAHRSVSACPRRKAAPRARHLRSRAERLPRGRASRCLFCCPPGLPSLVQRASVGLGRNDVNRPKSLRRCSSGGRGTRTPKGLRPAVFKFAPRLCVQCYRVASLHTSAPTVCGALRDFAVIAHRLCPAFVLPPGWVRPPGHAGAL
jgi:hypothetical protein